MRFWVLADIGHRYQLIFHQFIHSWFHSLIKLADVSQTSYRSHLVIKASHPYVLSYLVIHSGWLPQNQATDCLSMWYISFIGIHWLYITLSCCRYTCNLIVQPFTHALFYWSDIYSCIYVLGGRYTDRLQKPSSLSMRSISYIHTFRYLQYFTFTADITWFFNSPYVVHFIHSWILTVCFSLLFQTYPECLSVHPWIVICDLFIHEYVSGDPSRFAYSNIESTQLFNFLPCDFSCPNKTQLIECLAGSYAATGSIKCQPCPKGAFCPTKGQRAFHLCVNGTYSDVEGLSDCKICDAGYRCPSVGMEAPEECPNGTYSHSVGARYCVLCPEGHRWGYHLIINLFWVFNIIIILINQLSVFVLRLIHCYIGWIWHTHAVHINLLSFCSPMNCSFKRPLLMHISWPLYTQTTSPGYSTVYPCSPFHSWIHVFMQTFAVCYTLMLTISPGSSIGHVWYILFIHAYWLYATHSCSRYTLIIQPFIHKLFYSWDIHSCVSFQWSK